MIRPDGTIGDGDQVVSFRFELESSLIIAAHARDAKERGGRKDNQVRAMLPAGITPLGGTGNLHKPEYWNRIYIVYEWTRPAKSGGEWHEPFWVDVYRWAMLEPDRQRSALICDERRQRLNAAGLSYVPISFNGLLSIPTSRRLVARHALGPDPRTGTIIVPLVELYHAMSYARLILLYSMRWGPRFGEILQLRLGPDCFRSHPVGGVEEAYVALKPKGWSEHGKFGIDKMISDTLRQVKELTIGRWFLEELDEKGRPSLPVVEYRDCGRGDLPAARYFFQTRDRMLDQQELTYFMRILLLGILDMNTHDGRYVFTTLLGLDGVDYHQLGALLHHRPNTFTSRRYDLSGLLQASSAAERHNLRTDAALLGLVADG